MAGSRRKVVLASRNRDKLGELRELCADAPFEVVSALDYPGLPEVIEDGTTVLGNASRKAIITAAFTGEIAIADDTAFQITTLGGLPDVFASRFAGSDATYADNVALALELLRDVPASMRQARFVTAAVWVDPRPRAFDAGGAAPPVGAAARWLHNPFARAIHVKDPAGEPAFWEALVQHRAAWADYRARWGTIMVSQGADTERLLAVLDRLLAPLLAGGLPESADTATLRLPDTRLWTASGPAASEQELPTLVTPSGLPADAPGRGVNEPIWLELAAEGRLLGSIGREPVGWGGFGYDPIFRPHGLDRTLAELETREKHAVSHRGRALRRLLEAAVGAYGVTA